MNMGNKDPSRRLEIVRKAAPRSAKPSAVRRCRVVADSLGQVQVFIAQTRGPMALVFALRTSVQSVGEPTARVGDQTSKTSARRIATGGQCLP